MEVLNQVILTQTTLRSHTVHESTLTECTLRNVKLHNSTITNSTLHGCELYNCTICDTKLFNCRLYGANGYLKCEFTDKEVLGSKSQLEKLPAKIRDMIFEKCLGWEGKTPALLAALRGKKQLYAEALDIFRKSNTFWLRKASVKDFGKMSQKAVDGIQKLYFE